MSGYEGKCIRHGTEVDGRCREDHMADAESKLATISPLQSGPVTTSILDVYQGGYERLINGIEGKMAEEVAQEVTKELRTICPAPTDAPTSPVSTIPYSSCLLQCLYSKIIIISILVPTSSLRE